jgi:hypothetical protein
VASDITETETQTEEAFSIVLFFTSLGPFAEETNMMVL